MKTWDAACPSAIKSNLALFYPQFDIRLEENRGKHIRPVWGNSSIMNAVMVNSFRAVLSSDRLYHLKLGQCVIM